MNGVFSPIAVGAAVAFCTLAATGRMFADDSPAYGSVRTAHFQNIEGSSDAKPGCGFPTNQQSPGLIFPYVNYVMLSHEEAFRADDEVVAALFPVAESTDSVSIRIPAGSTGLRPNAGSSQGDAAALAQVDGVTVTLLDEKTGSDSETKGEGVGKRENPKGFVAKPMSSIRLEGIDKPVSRTGEPLKTPESSTSSDDNSPVAEEHITPEPWRRGHPSRNTFAFRHQPLYFEDPNLERCGQSAGYLTEAVNIIHFAGRIPLTGYMTGANPPCSRVRALPDCPTCQSFGADAYLPQPTLQAIAAQAAHSVGMVFLIP